MAFNVDHLLNKNSTPSQEQRNNLQSFIFQLDKDILNIDEDINEQILATQAKILVLQTRRAHLVQQRRSYSSLLSPLRCLPIEIFGKIFAYATRDCPRHVLNISAVCQLWRDAALGTPVLWSTLELGHHKSRRNMDDHIDSWIDRAHSHPLSLVIRKPEYSLGSVKTRIVHALVTEYPWKSITLDFGDTSILSILEKLEFSNFEMLESFSLASQNYVKLSFPNALRCAPKLKTLSLDIRYPIRFDMLPFPWRQLTSLTIRFWNSRHFNHSIGFDILQACVNLEEFIIDGDGHGPGRGSNDSITSNNLQKLHTSCYENKFLLSLKTPSIQDFAVKCSQSKYVVDDFYDYIEENGSTLLKLSIAPSDSRFVECIPHLRSLAELKLYDNDYDEHGSTFTHEILRSLVVKPDMDPSTIPLPRLETLEIICHATEENQRFFMKVISSRWWSDEEENARQKQGQRSLSRIKRSVIMNVHNELNMFCMDDVDVLRAQGMSVEYLAPFDGIDKDDFYTSRYYRYPPTCYD